MSVMVEFGEKKLDRHRKKRFYNSIRQQIEFYLGDVNLSKDRFFSRLLEQSPYIDVDVILKCNKIKKFTTDPKDIVKSLKKSSLLSVTEDGTKIFRTAPVTPVANADDCTIYVEDLPLEVDHEWLKNVFSRYGEVVYVSIPHYKGSNKIKGFAFVQFDTPENAIKALDAFGSVNACLSTGMAPTKLRSVQTFEGEKTVVVREHGPIHPENLKCVEVQSEKSETDETEPPPKKRKKYEEKPATEEKTACADRDEVETVEKENVEVHESKSKCKKVKVDSDEKPKEIRNNMSESEKTMEEEGNTEKKHEKKRKRKKYKKSKQVQTYGMQILYKQDWKKLRNKYLEEQRKRMHELKQQLRKASIKQSEKLKSAQESDDADNKIEDTELPASECRAKFVPGVIVKVNLDKPMRDVKHFKNDVKRYADVEYIDISENNTVAYFRCRSNEIANQVIALNKWPNMSILEGAEELSYWEKIKRDRKEKFENKIRCNTRGKNKLIKKVEAALATHIKFPE